LSKLFSGKQKSWTTFLEGREDDETIPRQSTFKHPLKVKAKLDSKSFRFPHTRLLLGLYDYKFKHLAIMEQEDCDVITILQTDGLAQLFGLEELESRTTPFQVGEDDEDIPAMHARSSPNATHQGQLTRSHDKRLQQEVHAILCEIHFYINENYILPKCCTLIVLRYIEEEKDESDPEDGLANRITRVKNGPVQVPNKLAKRTSRVKNGPVQRNHHNLLLIKAMKVHEDLLESLSSLLSNALSFISFGRRNQEFCLD